MSASKYRSLLKTAGFFGILTPAIAFSFIFSAITTYPSFSWNTNALSDLGVVEGLTSVLFNVGLVLTGLWAMVFGVGLLVMFNRNRVGQVGALIFAIAWVALILIGVFNENFEPTHLIVSVAFFVFLPISMFTITAAFGVVRKTKLAIFTLATALGDALPWILYLTLHYASNVAIPELISGLVGSVWTFAVGYLMVKMASDRA